MKNQLMGRPDMCKCSEDHTFKKIGNYEFINVDSLDIVESIAKRSLIHWPRKVPQLCKRLLLASLLEKIKRIIKNTVSEKFRKRLALEQLKSLGKTNLSIVLKWPAITWCTSLDSPLDMTVS